MADNKDKGAQDSGETCITIGAFFVFSFVPSVFYFIALSAAQEILAGTNMPTAVVLVCDIAPYCLGTLILPYIEHKLTQLPSMLVTCGLDLLGVVLMACVDSVNVQLIAVCLISLVSTFADVGLLSSTALYGEITVNAYSAGVGFGGLAASLYYGGVTTWFCVSMSAALMSITWLPLLLPIAYCLMDKKTSTHEAVSKATTYRDVPYVSLASECQGDGEDKEAQLTWNDRLVLIWSGMPFFLSFYAVVFCKFFLMNALVTSLAFSSAPFPPRDHYQYYVLAVLFGCFVGTWYGLVVSCLKFKVPLMPQLSLFPSNLCHT